MSDQHTEPVVCVSEYDLGQDKRIAELEIAMKLTEENRGKISLSSMMSMGSLLGFIFALLTGISSMWINGNLAPLREVLITIQADVSTIQKDIVRLEGVDESTASMVEDNRGTLAQTLRTEDVEQRLDAMRIQIDGQDGKFNRIVEGRLEPRIAKDEKMLDESIDRLNRHLQKDGHKH